MVRRAVPIILAVALIAVGFTQLDRYNVTWDEALGDLFFGQRYLSYFTTFDTRYLDFAHDPYPPGYVPDLRSSEFRNRPWEYWPVANTLAAATSRVLSNGLHLVDPFDGFHAFNFLAGAVWLILFYRFVEDRQSCLSGQAGSPVLHTTAAIVATTVLFLMPRIVCDLMANIKDFPEMLFFSATLIAFFIAYERASIGGIIASGVLWGLALGTKANAWFVPLVILAFVAVRGLGPWRDRRRLTLAIVGAGVLGIVILFAFWPYLWPAPFTRIVYNFRYLALAAQRAKPGTTLNPWLAIASTTPPVVLLAAAASLPLMIRRALRREPFSIFLLAWLLVVSARISLGANFDGVRHFLEIFPPIAAIVGIGTAVIPSVVRDLGAGRRVIAPHAPRSLANARDDKPLIRVIVAAIPIAATAYATIASHPFETAYWNAFIGGLSGAQRRNVPQSCDYWAASYRLGLQWIDENVPRRSVLIVPIAGHTVQLVAPLRLRPDIIFVRYPRGGGEMAAQQRLRQVGDLASRAPLYVMFVPRRDWSTELDTDCMRRLTPVHAWMLGGAPVLLIYRYTPR